MEVRGAGKIGNVLSKSKELFGVTLRSRTLDEKMKIGSL